ncbi:ribosomal protein L49/IMG2 [Suillus paluster]|uniref:ribosomal protein L49/IMG2 n=1 Tax=Suillus paluster TaxID=48578 RepID=UPI001B868610|nr:ribosomal protein L49/IMG2 [Suillus paluster]KAG1749021.1 ribosomal protein L49/IMG2 [Suillus paluster]
MTSNVLIRRTYPYFIRRNTRGSLPVYTDIRNGGTKYQVSIRNVHGQLNSLANDINQSLFKQGTPEANRLKVQVVAQKHLVLSGGHWKNEVINWLNNKGF